jgi:hypothetical protein
MPRTIRAAESRELTASHSSTSFKLKASFTVVRFANSAAMLAWASGLCTSGDRW